MQLFETIEKGIIEEDCLKSNTLQPLKNKLGYFILHNEKVKKIYNGKIGSKSGLFIAFASQMKSSEMHQVLRSTDLNKYIRTYSIDKKKQWEDQGTTLPIKLGFGSALPDNEIVSMDFFVNTPLTHDKLLLSSAPVNEPRNKHDKARRRETKTNSTVLESYLKKCYSSENCQLYHGFVTEMKTCIWTATVFCDDKMKMIKAIEESDTFSLPVSFLNHFRVCCSFIGRLIPSDNFQCGWDETIQIKGGNQCIPYIFPEPSMQCQSTQIPYPPNSSPSSCVLVLMCFVYEH